MFIAPNKMTPQTTTPTPVNALNTSGSCGDNATYTLDATGLLTISGTGAIAEDAFSYEENIVTVDIGNGITSIGNYAFSDCSELTSITIPNSVTSIGNYAFSDCSELTSITIPNSVTSIGDAAFDGTGYLNNFLNGTGTGDVLYNGVHLIKAKDTITECTIDGNTKTIVGGAFYNCQGLTSIEIPDSVTSIGDEAFGNCSELERVIIGAGVTELKDNVFSGCRGLRLIATLDKVTSIGGLAFGNYSKLTSIEIPTCVTSIFPKAFSVCSSLTSVAIHKSVNDIANSAFESCSSLETITVNSNNTVYNSKDNCNAIIKTSTKTLIAGCKNTKIPDSVTSIGDSAFLGCSGLTSVTIGAGVTSIGGFAFKNCRGLTSITIPSSVKTIGNSAFESCSGLMSVTIPNSVTSIGSWAFSGCYNLTICGSGNTDSAAYNYAKNNKINYATAWVKKDSTTHTRTFYGFKTNSNATAETQTNSHNFVDGICSECGAIDGFSITLNVTTNVSRYFVIYVLDSNNQPIRQFAVTNGDNIVFTVAKSSAFTIQVYETLYMSATIGGTKTLKRTYTNLTEDKTIAIDISGVTNVNNWVMI